MEVIEPEIRVLSTEEERIICARMMAGSAPWTTLGITHKHLLNTLSDSLFEVYVAYVGQELVGAIILQTKGALTGYLKSIVVKNSWRHKHLGNYLMEFVETTVFAKQQNVFLCVSSFNLKAQKFYRKLGYEVVGKLKNYVINGEDEILMRKTIGPILYD